MYVYFPRFILSFVAVHSRSSHERNLARNSEFHRGIAGFARGKRYLDTTKAVPNRLDTRTNQNNSLVISTPRLDSSRWIHCSWIIIEVRNGPPWNLCSVAGNRFYYSNKVRSPCTGRMAHCSFFIKNERRRNNVSFSFVKIF